MIRSLAKLLIPFALFLVSVHFVFIRPYLGIGPVAYVHKDRSTLGAQAKAGKMAAYLGHKAKADRYKPIRKAMHAKLSRLTDDKCPKYMALVYSEAKGINICVDKFESSIEVVAKPNKIKPTGNFSYYSCSNLCEAQGKRLLTNLEWNVACEGTVANKCNVKRSHPVLRRLKMKEPWVYKNIDCKKGNNAWLECMKDPSLNRLTQGLDSNSINKDCKSKYGIYNMVGNLGEWVDDNHYEDGTYRGRFNGGLYPQAKSSCSYTTTAHSPSYKDYSIGCRCAKNA